MHSEPTIYSLLSFLTMNTIPESGYHNKQRVRDIQWVNHKSPHDHQVWSNSIP